MVSINLQKTILKLYSQGYKVMLNLKNSRHAQFNCLEYYQKIPNNKGSRRFASNRSSKMHENSTKKSNPEGKEFKETQKD